MGKFTILELNDAEAKILQVSHLRKKHTVLEFAAAIDLSDLPKDEGGAVQRGARIREAFKSNKIPITPCGLLIPKQSAILRVATLPSSDPEEIAEMSLFETEKFIPFNAERHIVSSSVLHTDEVNGSAVLLTAIDSPVMDTMLAITRAAGLEVVVAEVTSIALLRAWQAWHTEPTAEDTSTILLNVGRTQSEITIMDKGLLAASRSQSLGTDKLLKDLQEAMHLSTPPSATELATLDMTSPDDFLIDGGVARAVEDEGVGDRTAVGEKARDWVTRTTRFLRQTFEFAVREHSVNPAGKIYLSGEATALQNVAKALSAQLGVPVEVFDPVSAFEVSPKATIPPGTLNGMACAAGTAIRLVEEEEEPKLRENRINLLPAAMIERQEASEKKILLMISGAMVLITLILVYLAWDTQNAHATLLAGRLKEYNREMAPLLSDIEKKKDQLDIISQITSNRAGAMEILDKLSEFPGMGPTTKNGVLTISEFTYTTRDDVTIGGVSMTFEDMQRFASFLEELSIDDRIVFQSVGLPQPTAKSLGPNRPTVYFFQVTAILNNFGETEDE